MYRHCVYDGNESCVRSSRIYGDWVRSMLVKKKKKNNKKKKNRNKNKNKKTRNKNKKKRKFFVCI